MTKRLLFLLYCCFGWITISAQTQDAWVYFKDKPLANNYLASPHTMLSQRALDRRAKFQIALDAKDVPIDSTYIRQIRSSSGINILAKSKWLNALHIRGTKNDLLNLTNLSFVDNVYFADRSLNTSAKPEITSRLNKQKDKLAIHANFNYGSSLNQLKMIQGDFLHQKNFTGTGIEIAVLDAGFPGVDTNAAFQRMRNNNHLLGGYNFVDRTSNIYTRHYHGSAVLSTMAGYIEGQLVGSAPDADYYLFITEDFSQENPLEESLWVEAAEKADSLGVDIINSSLGYTTFDNPNYNYTKYDMDGKTAFISRGAEIAFSRGILVVNSAGNEGVDKWKFISAPADAADVLSVGAVDASGTIASFSSFGPTADGRIKPDVCAQGVASTIITSSGNLGNGDGTSFSSPILAGVIACLWEAFPTLTNTELLKYIRESSSLYSSPTEQEGYGIPNFQLIYNTLLNKINHPYQFIIYPNPTSALVKIELPLDVNEAEVFLMNDIGSIMLQQKITRSNPSIDISHLIIGYYFLEIKYKNGVLVHKLIKK